MSFYLTIFIYNFLLLLGVFWILWRCHKQPMLSKILPQIFIWSVCAIFLAKIMAFDLFHFLTHAAGAIFFNGTIGLFGLAFVLKKSYPKLAITLILMSLTLIAIAVDAFFIEPYALEVSHIKIHNSKVKRPLKIAVLADIQTDHVGRHEKKALQLAMEAHPDIILLPGDFIQAWNREEWSKLVNGLRRIFKEVNLGAPLGIYAVGGNIDSAGTKELFDGFPVKWVPNTTRISLPELDITALSFSDSLRSNIEVNGSDKFHLVVGHVPNFALGDVNADLLVAGHTHGGQVQLPFLGPLITLSDIPRKWASGVTDLGHGRTLVVSRGIGMERFYAPRLRFLCRPEVVVIHLEGVR